MIRVMIADDHQLITDGLRLMLAAAPDISCIAAASNGREALALLPAHTPDVLLLDINMPEMDGLACCKEVHRLYPDIRILALSMRGEGSLIRTMLQQGASGFLLKNMGQDELIQAIRDVYAGKQVFSPDALDAMLSSWTGQKTAPEHRHPLPKLSRREKEILRLIVEEKTTAEIAADLFISFGTVETHRRNLLFKLNARNTAGLVRAALSFDLLA